MPKNNVDYANTIIYKICCKDETIKDLYVGHTTNFIQRKYLHKQACNNLDNKLKIYNVIRFNGGWENWDMVEIAKYNCKDATEARIKEHQHYNELNASLNSCPPYVDNKKYFCDICKLQCTGPKQYNNHINSIKHIKNIDNTNIILNEGHICVAENNEIMPKLCPKNFSCEICNYNTSSLKDYTKHLNTNKHINRTQLNNLELKNPNVGFICKKCNKCYKARNSLWYHEQKCNQIVSDNKNEPSDKQLIMMLLKQNSEIIKEHSELIKENSELRKEQADIKELILEIVKNGTHNTTNTTTNSHNKAFNLQFFLNETCKNAMNITDFVDSIKLQLSDFISMGEVGFIEGMSNIIVKNLNSLDETVRPIHCTDQKRETFYVKDENKWEKEEEDKKKLKKMIKGIAYKNEKLIKKYKETYPDYNNSDSRRSDQYSKIMIEAMDTKDESREKIIRNVSKATIIKRE